MSGDTEELEIAFDADNHYWEASDAFTRHRDPAFAERGVQVQEIDGTLRYVLGGELFMGLPGPADVHARPAPGSFLGLFAGRTKREDFTASFQVPPSDHPEWYDRDARLKVLDDQGIESTWLFPSQGVVLEAPMFRDDVEAGIECMRAFNHWVEEDWGFAYQDRIFAAACLNLSDPARAVDELQWSLDHGARLVNLRHGPAITRDGFKSPADPMFDGFWGLAQEAGVVVASHAGSDYSYLDIHAAIAAVYGGDPSAPEPAPPTVGLGGVSMYQAMTKGRQIHDYAFVLVAHRLFERFPRLRYAFVENGSAWVPPLLQALEYLDHGGNYEVNPREQFLEHCWVTPFPEEDVVELARHLPVEHILFGSDWPHGEGFALPLDFLANVSSFTPAQRQRIMYDNARELTFAGR